MTQFRASTVSALCLILQMDDSLQVRVAFAWHTSTFCRMTQQAFCAAEKQISWPLRPCCIVTNITVVSRLGFLKLCDNRPTRPGRVILTRALYRGSKSLWWNAPPSFVLRLVQAERLDVLPSDFQIPVCQKNSMYTCEHNGYCSLVLRADSR
jgi:hypothetical protein